jgi:hypothetical protein
MKTITLRTLVREPLKVKRMTRTGDAVQVTDKGRPLWVLHPAALTDAEEAERSKAIDVILDEILREKPSKLSLSKIVLESRR